jgi:UDP-N-acetylmuramoylalanine--D-glutamate ligase
LNHWEASLPKAPLRLADLSGHCVLIVGVGREGRAMASRLLSLPQPPQILALEGAEGPAADSFRQEFPTIALAVAGPDSTLPAECAKATLAVMSPGIAVTSPLHAALVDLSIPLTSGSALFVADHRESLAGITGSKGKSTTTTLVHALLGGSEGGIALGGNMGIPLQGLDSAEFYAVELSSYQCHYLEVSPDVVGLTALFPEHLDWHGSLDAYYQDKLSIVAHGPSHVIANADDAILVHELTTRYPHLEVTWVGEGQHWHLEEDGAQSWLCQGDQKLFHTGTSQILGRHNHLNMVLALAIADATGRLDRARVEEVFSGFEGLAHRLQRIADPSGVVFVNDSLATNPQAGAAALRSLSSPGMVWIVGGQDRGVDYQPLVDQVLQSRPAHILGVPASGVKLLGLFREALVSAGAQDAVHLEDVPDMATAVRRARALASAGDYVVLSPAAPSFGQYRDYQHRAEDFLTWIEKTRHEETA